MLDSQNQYYLMSFDQIFQNCLIANFKFMRGSNYLRGDTVYTEQTESNHAHAMH